MTDRVLVLDSSFNPPHRGHSALVAKSIAYPFPTPPNQFSIQTINTRSVLLLLSLKNADKQTKQLRSYTDRLEMMQMLASHIASEFGVACSIALTNRSLFVDKQQVITNHLESLYPTRRDLDLTFLLGFDTLIRVLDPKYYTTDLNSALAPLFNSSSCFVLARDTPSYPLAAQTNYLSSNQLPSSWASKIHIVDADSSSVDISSSLIRKMAHEHSHMWQSMTYPDIARYIETHALY